MISRAFHGLRIVLCDHVAARSTSLKVIVITLRL